MESGIEKYTINNIEKCKVTRTKGIRLPDGNSINSIDKTR